MVYCVAVNCRSENHQTASGEKVSFHCFPKDKKLRKIWEQKVNRKNWSVDKCSRRAAVLCGLHFEPDQFTINPVLAKSVGYQPRSLTLKPGSIPTIFDRGASQECDEPPVPKKRRYCERRDREELLETLTKPNEVPVVDVASDDHLVVEAPMQADASDRGESDTDSPPPTPYRLMHPFTYAPTPIIKEPPQKMDKKIGCKPEMKTKSTQTAATETPSLKTPLPVASQSLPTPSVPEPSTMPVPHPAQHSFTLPPPVNNSCNCCCTCQDDTAYSPQKVAHTTRSGRKTWIRTVSFDDAESATNPDEDFCPDEVDEDPDSEDEDLGDTACSEEPSSNPKAERKYIVFETKLLELLRHCRLCGAKAKQKYQQRSRQLQKKNQIFSPRREMASSLMKLVKQWLSTIAIHIVRLGPVPRHVAIIMDGNRRYARQFGLDRRTGHEKGRDAALQTLHYASRLGIEEVTLYAFSLENFKRTEDEVNDIMEVIASLLNDVYDVMRSDPVKVNWCYRSIGDLSLMPRKIQELTAKLHEVNQDNARFTINMCMAYTARDDMCLAMREVAEGVNNKEIKESDISESLLGKCMRTAQLRPVDLLIRTSGEKRLSDFLLWEEESQEGTCNERRTVTETIRFLLCPSRTLEELRGKDTTLLDCDSPQDPIGGILQSKDFETLVEEYTREREQRIEAFLRKLYKNRNDYIMSFLQNNDWSNHSLLD